MIWGFRSVKAPQRFPASRHRSQHKWNPPQPEVTGPVQTVPILVAIVTASMPGAQLNQKCWVFRPFVWSVWSPKKPCGFRVGVGSFVHGFGTKGQEVVTGVCHTARSRMYRVSNEYAEVKHLVHATLSTPNPKRTTRRQLARLLVGSGFLEKLMVKRA